MMNLYEINNEILSLVDEETGEILDFERFEQLNMEKEQKTENIALWIKNLNADSDMLKKEIDNLNDRKKKAERKEEQLRKYLSYMLDGQSFKTPKVACSFRKSTSVQVDDEQSFVNWAMENRKDLLSFKQPTISKTEIKNCLKAGEISIDDSLVRQIMTLRYINGMTWNAVADTIGGNTEDSIRMIHNRFLSNH